MYKSSLPRRIYWLGYRTREIGRIVFNGCKQLFTREKCPRKKKSYSEAPKRQQCKKKLKLRTLFLKICLLVHQLV